MRATCPSCDAVYEVPDRLIGSGRKLRCTNCGHEWILSPAASGAAPVAEPPAPRAPSALTPAPLEPRAGPPSQPMLRRPPQVIDPPLPAVDDTTGRRIRGDLALRAAWAVSVLVVVVALVALWVFRHEIAAAWPPASRLVGMPVGGG